MSKGIMDEIIRLFSLGYTDKQIQTVTGYNKEYDIKWIQHLRTIWENNKKAP